MELTRLGLQLLLLDDQIDEACIAEDPSDKEEDLVRDYEELICTTKCAVHLLPSEFDH